MTEPAAYGRLFWACVLFGWAVMAYGVVGALDNARDTHPRSLAIWIVGSLAGHDLVIAPLVFLSGGALRRVAGPRVRRPVQTALIVSAALVVISVPVVGGFGITADNPSALPRNYWLGAGIALAIVWTVMAAALFVAWLRTRRA